MRESSGKSSFTVRENLVTRPWTGQESSSMTKLGDEDPAQNVKERHGWTWGKQE